MNRYKIPPQHRKIIADQLRQALEEDWDSQITSLAANAMVDLMAQKLGPHIYNQAIAHAIDTTQQRMQLLEEDLYALAATVPYLDD